MCGRWLLRRGNWPWRRTWRHERLRAAAAEEEEDGEGEEPLREAVFEEEVVAAQGGNGIEADVTPARHTARPV